jgi:hypothetical protein
MQSGDLQASVDFSSCGSSRRNAVMVAARGVTTVRGVSVITASTSPHTTGPIPSTVAQAGDLAIAGSYMVMTASNYGTVVTAPTGWSVQSEVVGPVLDGSASTDWLRVWSKVATGITVGGESVIRQGPTIAAGSTHVVVLRGAEA